jgi:prepilin peptidase CpaA
LTAQFSIAAVVGIAAVVDDLKRRHIANWIPALAFTAGLILKCAQGGWRGAGSSLLGTLAGAGVFLIFYLLGGMGGGDVKLMAGFGALLGPKLLLEAALWTGGCGGLMAALVLGWNSVRNALRPAKTAAGMAEEDGSKEEEQSKTKRVEAIPYAPAITAGVWLALVPKG